MVAQKSLRNRYLEKLEQKLSLYQLAGIGTQVAVIVSVVSAPFDVANTLKQVQNLKSSPLCSRNFWNKLYCGWPINTLALIIHNVASVIVIDKLG